MSSSTNYVFLIAVFTFYLWPEDVPSAVVEKAVVAVVVVVGV